MKIGDEVYIHGFVDEIRKDTVIIRNKGGYFGTDAEEVAPTVEPMRWIPVTERLPEAERKSYWVCTDTGYQCECRWTNNRFGIGESDKWGWSIFDIPRYTKVVAWMPLPEPWKGEEEGCECYTERRSE